MKSGSADCFRVNWRRALGNAKILARFALLLVGYHFLLPAHCAQVAEKFAGWLGLDAAWWGTAGGRVGPAVALSWGVMAALGLFRASRFEWAWTLGAVAAAGTAAFFWGNAFGPWWGATGQRLADALYAGMFLVLAAGWLASRLYDSARSGGGRALVLVVLLIGGCMLYEQLASKSAFEFRDDRWVRPVQVLTRVFGVIDKPHDMNYSELPGRLWPGGYYLFHAVLAFFGGFVIIGGVSKAIANAMVLRLSPPPDCVFWGVSPEGLALAKSLKKGKGDYCVFAVEDAAEVEAAGFAREGFLWVVDGREIPSGALRRAKHHFFLTPEGSRNVANAERLARVAQGETEACVRIDEEADDAWLHLWADRDDIKKRLNVRIVRDTALTADALLESHPMLESPGVVCRGGLALGPDGKPAQFRLLLVGFGWQGRMILSRTICDAQAPGTLFSADVVDRDVSAWETFARRCPDAVKQYHVSFLKADATRKSFFEWLDGRLAWADAYGRIVVATGDDALNLEVAAHVDRHFRERGDVEWRNSSRERLFVRVRHPEEFALENSNSSLHFTLFGSVESVYSEGIIADSDIERIARSMNARWASEDDRIPDEKKIRSAWRDASFFNKESSRASAMGIENMWRLAGVSLPKGDEARKREWKNILKQRGKDNRRRRIGARLAEAEHLRWMAFHFVRGIKSWKPEEDPVLWKRAGDRPRANLREKANRHAALIPFDKLPQLDLRLEAMSWRQRLEKWPKDGPLAELAGRFKSYADEVEKRMEKSPMPLLPDDLLAKNKCAAMWVKWEKCRKECRKEMTRLADAFVQTGNEIVAKAIVRMWKGEVAGQVSLPFDASHRDESRKTMGKVAGFWRRWLCPGPRKAFVHFHKFLDQANKLFEAPRIPSDKLPQLDWRKEAMDLGECPAGSPLAELAGCFMAYATEVEMPEKAPMSLSPNDLLWAKHKCAAMWVAWKEYRDKCRKEMTRRADAFVQAGNEIVAAAIGRIWKDSGNGPTALPFADSDRTSAMEEMGKVAGFWKWLLFPGTRKAFVHFRKFLIQANELFEAPRIPSDKLSKLDWRKEAMDLGECPAGSPLAELAGRFAAYATEVEMLEKVPMSLSPNDLLWAKHKCAAMWVAWKEYRDKCRKEMTRRADAFVQAGDEIVAAAIGRMWKGSEDGPNALPFAESDRTSAMEEMGKVAGFWRRLLFPGTRRALSHFDKFLIQANKIFENPRFLTEGNLVENDYKVVRNIPEYRFGDAWPKDEE